MTSRSLIVLGVAFLLVLTPVAVGSASGAETMIDGRYDARHVSSPLLFDEDEDDAVEKKGKKDKKGTKGEKGTKNTDRESDRDEDSDDERDERDEKKKESKREKRDPKTDDGDQTSEETAPPSEQEEADSSDDDDGDDDRDSSGDDEERGPSTGGDGADETDASSTDESDTEETDASSDGDGNNDTDSPSTDENDNEQIGSSSDGDGTDPKDSSSTDESDTGQIDSSAGGGDDTDSPGTDENDTRGTESSSTESSDSEQSDTRNTDTNDTAQRNPARGGGSGGGGASDGSGGTVSALDNDGETSDDQRTIVDRPSEETEGTAYAQVTTRSAAPTTETVSSAPVASETVVTDVSFQPRRISTNVQAIVFVTIQNPQSFADSHLVELELFGEVVAARAVTIPGGGQTTVEFVTTFEAPGTYTVRVDDETATITVVAPGDAMSTDTTSTQFPGFGPIAVLTAALLATLLLGRRD